MIARGDAAIVVIVVERVAERVTGMGASIFGGVRDGQHQQAAVLVAAAQVAACCSAAEASLMVDAERVAGRVAATFLLSAIIEMWQKTRQQDSFWTPVLVCYPV